MAADLGSWPAEQATVLLEVLQAAGLHPEARRSRDGVHVTVPDDEGDRAHATLVAQMDTIARAARPAAAPRTRKLRAVEGGGGGHPSRGGAGGPRRRKQRAGTASRARRLADPATLVLVVGFVVAVLFPAARTFAVFAAVAVTLWMLGRRTA